MKEFFNPPPKEVKNPTPEDFKRKHQTVLTDICGKWFLNHMKNTKPPIKIPRLDKKRKKGTRKIQGELKVVYDHYKDWKFHIRLEKCNMSCISNVIKRRPFVHLQENAFRSV